MVVLGHEDPFVLEDELLRRVSESRGASPSSPFLVVVPTERLARHVRARIVRRLGATLGVEVVHHRALARRVLEAAGLPVPRLAHPRLLEAALGRATGNRKQGGDLAAFLRRRPGAAGRLHGTLRELREAGIEPATVAECLRASGEAVDLAEIYAAWIGELDRIAGSGSVDDAGLVARAAAAVERLPRPPWPSIVHHGAYEVVGMHLDLLRALAGHAELTFLVPCRPGAPAFRYAEGYARRHLDPDGIRPIEPGDGDRARLGDRLAALYDENSRLSAAETGSVSLHDARGDRDEILLATRIALAATRDRSPDEVAVIARSLEPYAAALDDALDFDSDLPWTSSAGLPLRRDPVLRDLLALLRVVDEDFPRSGTVEILSSPFVRWEALAADGERPDGDLAEERSREAGIPGGRASWTETLPERFDDEPTRAIARAVDALAAAVGEERPARWTEHADRVERIARDLFLGAAGGKTPEAAASLFELLDAMRSLETALGESEPVPSSEATAWLADAVDATVVSPRERDDGGPRVLDAMQARGLTFERVVLAGYHGGSTPRASREDPFLRDATRRRLRDGTGRPLAIKEEGTEEERLLLAMQLGSARDAIDLTRQRADDKGRTRSPSPALREVARLVVGRPDLDRLLAEASSSLPAHPETRLLTLRDATGLLRKPEAERLFALRAGSGSDEAKALVSRMPHWGRSIEMIADLDGFGPTVPRWDARVGAARARRLRWSVSELETLGACPLLFFFRHRLGVEELEDEADPFGLAPSEMGSRIHSLLEDLYGALAREGFVGTGGKPVGRELLRDAIARAWERAFGDADAAIGSRFPVAWSAVADAWKGSLERLVAEDLDRLGREGATVVGFETRREGKVPAGPRGSVVVRGRFDRIARVAAGDVVTDYKTSGSLTDRANVTRMLKGLALQVPLYAAIAGDGATVELVGAGPQFDPEGGTRAGERFVAFAGLDESDAASFRESLAVILDLDAAGSYPFSEDAHTCRWCAFAAACRRNHVPSAFREASAADVATFRAIRAKKAKRRTAR